MAVLDSIIEGSLMSECHGRNKTHQEYIKITVRNPRTHISRDKALYTDYEIRIETNNIAFACTDSCVRRRYSDFQWLRNRLLSQFALERSLPELPPKKVFGRFKRQFLKNRQKGLQAFLEDITGQSTYLSDIAVHLFLQTSLSVSEIQDKMTNGTDSGGELLEEYQSPSIHGGCTSLSRSCSAYEDHDSGFSYSTASSLNDCVAPHTSCDSTIDGCDIMNPKDVEQNLSCYADSTEHETTLQSLNPISQEVSGNDTDPDNVSSNYYFTSDDEGYCCSNYDADDEDIYRQSPRDEENNNRVPSLAEDDDDDSLFCFRIKSDHTIYTINDAMEILKQRPKLTDRLYCQEDSDDCFRESEYDVIDTDDSDNADIVEVINGTTNNPDTSRIEIKVRAHTLNDEGRLIEVKTTPVRDKNKLKIGKVRSLPGIRFPIRNGKSKCYRSTSEISLVSAKSQQKLDTVYDELILKESYLTTCTTPTKSHRSESSDADYLTTINRCYSADSQIDTNIETQTEDTAPTKFFSMLKLNSKKRKKTIQRLEFQTQDHSSKGRFQVTTVDEVATPENEVKFTLGGKHSLLTSSTTDEKQLVNGSLKMHNRDLFEHCFLKSYEIL
ncbi:uncharacterized protein [Clytia hemisphaerica]|uniref:uncharacterized protein isoform X1 n=1 Tax=Clytia hemisphaerica TaxID=252671 RepID=UPI0034D49F38